LWGWGGGKIKGGRKMLNMSYNSATEF